MSPQYDKAFELINQAAQEMGLPSIFGEAGSCRNRSSFIYYEPPKDWPNTVYVFGYTPWKTFDPKTGKTGFFALKYRKLKSGALKLVNSVRFARRKIATARALKWHGDYYRGGNDSEENSFTPDYEPEESVDGKLSKFTIKKEE